LVNPAIAFAATTASPLISVSAVGPTKSSSSPSVPAFSAARFASRFLTMLKTASASPSFSRSSAAWGTLMPR
jgi:hypothetical protein